MFVIYGKENADKLVERMTILELDTFFQTGMSEPLPAFAVLSMEEIPFQEVSQIESMRDLHNNMIVEYRKKNFNFCIQALEHLNGKWSGTLDSFYKIFEERVKELDIKVPDNWDGIIYKDA